MRQWNHGGAAAVESILKRKQSSSGSRLHVCLRAWPSQLLLSADRLNARRVVLLRHLFLGTNLLQPHIALSWNDLTSRVGFVYQAPVAPPFHCHLGTLEKYEEGWQEGDRVTSTYTKLRDLVPVDREERTYDWLTFSRSGTDLFSQVGFE